MRYSVFGIRVESITKRRQTQIISAYFRTLIDNFFCLRETERERVRGGRGNRNHELNREIHQRISRMNSILLPQVRICQNTSEQTWLTNPPIGKSILAAGFNVIWIWLSHSLLYISAICIFVAPSICKSIRLIAVMDLSLMLKSSEPKISNLIMQIDSASTTTKKKAEKTKLEICCWHLFIYSRARTKSENNNFYDINKAWWKTW